QGVPIEWGRPACVSSSGHDFKRRQLWVTGGTVRLWIGGFGARDHLLSNWVCDDLCGWRVLCPRQGGSPSGRISENRKDAVSVWSCGGVDCLVDRQAYP